MKYKIIKSTFEVSILSLVISSLSQWEFRNVLTVWYVFVFNFICVLLGTTDKCKPIQAPANVQVNCVTASDSSPF
jgi:hypothetical protein